MRRGFFPSVDKMKTIENFDGTVIQSTGLKELYGGGGWSATRYTVSHVSNQCSDVEDEQKTNIWGTNKVRILSIESRFF